MDSGKGYFIPMKDLHVADQLREEHPKSKGIFTVGEELQIRGSKFRVKDISPFGIKLKLLPQEK